MFSESDLVEFKREFSKTVLKTIVAFANTKGGVVYLGIEDDGSICGVENPDAVMLATMNSIRSSIKPNSMMVVQCEVLAMEGKQVVGVRVERGAKRPYYLADKGMRPEGVYVRQGPASFMASEAEIIEMLKASRGSSFEEGRSLRQDLTFDALAASFSERGYELGEAQMRTLGLVDEDGQFTNAGALLSDQCDSSIKLASFFGTKRTTFKSRLETQGSLVTQLDQALDFLAKYSDYQTKFVNMRRVDYEDFPPDAVREALVNAVVHQDYDAHVSLLISVLEDRIEIVSYGGLPGSRSLDEFQMDVSVLRNPKLAAVFYRLGLIEAYGTGIARMFEAYEGSSMTPVFDITKHLLKVVLPNRNWAGDASLSRTTCAQASRGDIADAGNGGGSHAIVAGKQAEPVDDFRNQERVVLSVLEGQGPLKRSEIQERFDFSQATMLRILKRLEEQGLVRAEGNTRRRIYRATGSF